MRVHITILSQFRVLVDETRCDGDADAEFINQQEHTMRGSTFALAAIIACLATNVSAATFDFNYTFDGTTISQDVGSDTAAGTSLEVGDSFTATVAASGSNFFQVDVPIDDTFIPMSYFVSGSAARTADISASFLLDGVLVASIIDLSQTQSFVHIGAQLWTLAQGLQFDTVILDWSFLAIDDDTVQTVINDSSDFFGFSTPFFNSPSISFQEDLTAVPLPAGLPLLAAGLLGLGLLRRRKT